MKWVLAVTREEDEDVTKPRPYHGPDHEGEEVVSDKLQVKMVLLSLFYKPQNPKEKPECRQNPMRKKREWTYLHSEERELVDLKEDGIQRNEETRK